MNKYLKPEIIISYFNNESVVTASDPLTAGMQEWYAQYNGTSAARVAQVSFNDLIEIQ